MANQKQHKGGGSRKWDRSPKRGEKKRKKYQTEKIREKNKLKRILHSEGIKAANAYADTHEIWGMLRKLLA